MVSVLCTVLVLTPSCAWHCLFHVQVWSGAELGWCYGWGDCCFLVVSSRGLRRFLCLVFFIFPTSLLFSSSVRYFICFILFYRFVMAAVLYVSIYGYISSLNASVAVVICTGSDSSPRFVATRSGRLCCVRVSCIFFVVSFGSIPSSPLAFRFGKLPGFFAPRGVCSFLMFHLGCTIECHRSVPWCFLYAIDKLYKGTYCETPSRVCLGSCFCYDSITTVLRCQSYDFLELVWESIVSFSDLA